MFSQGFGNQQQQYMPPNPSQNQGVQNNPYYGNMGAYAPLPYQAFGSIPSINPSLIQGGDINSQLAPYAQAVDASMQPMFQQQSGALDSDMASRGIFNSGAANASQGNLLAQQFGQVLGQSLPYAQQNLQGNQMATNQALGENAAAYGQVAQGNQNLYNNWQNELFQGNMNRGNQFTNAYMNSYDPAGSGNLIGQGMNNAGQAYGNAYGNAMQNSGGLGQAFTGAFNYFFPGGNPAGGNPNIDPNAMAQPFN